MAALRIKRDEERKPPFERLKACGSTSTPEKESPTPISPLRWTRLKDSWLTLLSLILFALVAAGVFTLIGHLRVR